MNKFESSRASVTFVVVNWNQRQLTLECLASLRGQEYPRFTTVVVDNGSADGSADAVRDSYPEVMVLETGRNLGIAGGNNVGIRHALESGAAYVFLLNNDTVVDPKMLARLVKIAESEPDVGMVGPMILYHDEPEIIWCAGAVIDWRSGSTTRLLDGQPLTAAPQSRFYDVDFTSSCAVCIDRRVFEEVGLMDERYFIYYDETDWFARASAAGWRTVIVPAAWMWHKVSATMGTTSPATDYYMDRNVLLFLAKNGTGWIRGSSLARAAARNLLAVAAYTVKPHSGQRLPHRDARLLALRDALLGRWGKMGADVQAICYPEAGEQ